MASPHATWFSSRLGLPVFAGDPDKTTLARRVAAVAILMVLAQGADLVTGPWPPSIRALGLAAAYFAGTCVLLIGIRVGRVRHVGRALIGFVWAMLVYEAATTGGIASPDLHTLTAVCVGAAVFLGVRTGAAVTALTIAAGIALWMAEWQGWLPAPQRAYTRADYLRIEISSVLFASVFAGMAIRDVSRSLRSARRQLEERRQAEAALLDREAMLEAFYSTTATAIAITTADGRFIRVNQAYLEMFGFPSLEDLLLTRPIDSYHPDEREAVAAAGERLLTSAITVFRQECRFVRYDRSLFWGDLSVTAIRAGGGRPATLVTLITDITSRKHAETQLRQKQKMEALGQLAGGVAHDFNNLLTVIQGHLELLLTGTEGGLAGDARASMKAIEAASSRAARLTRQLLAFSRRQVLQVQAVQLNELVTGIARLLQRTLGETVRVTLQLDPTLAPIEADSGLIEQVIMNLAVNARDAMPDGGRMTLRTSSVTIASGAAPGDGDRQPGDYACLTVSDTGTGMTETVAAQAFQPFFTTKEPGAGTGLGLSMVEGIIKQHRGWIELSTVPGQGSEFHVFLPLSRGPAQPSATGIGADRAGGRGETVLLVEDEPSVRALVEALLRRLGYNVLLAESGADALGRWAGLRDRVHLLITDMVMPEGVSGRNLADRLRVDRPGLRVIFISGYSVELAADGLRPEPGVAFLQKPFSIDALAGAIRRVMAAV
jgi:two-component system, cell cycle sensor histidine kinase and response regulator CckA